MPDTPKNETVTVETTSTEEVKYPQGWSVTNIGAEGYLVAHDGSNPDGGQPSGGHAFKVHDLKDVPAVIKHLGKIPDKG